MEWTGDVSAGDWLRGRLDDPPRGTIHDVAPRGFEAYVRILHPVHLERIPNERMPSFDAVAAMTDAGRESLFSRIEERPLTWREAAGIFGTEFSPLADWEHLTRSTETPGVLVTPAGDWVNPPLGGELDPAQVAEIATVLASHTAAPDDGVVALWDGHPGLLGGMRVRSSRAVYQAGDPSDANLHRHNEMLGRSAKDLWSAVTGKRTWHDGILSREISAGPRLELPGRTHVLFRGGVSELADLEWTDAAPWRGEDADDILSPSLIWPDDRAWVLVSDPDLDSTLVGGSAALAAALVARAGLDAVEIPGDAVLEGHGVTR